MNQGFSHLVRLFRFYAYGLWDRRWSIAIVAWVLCLCGWLAVAMIPNRYTSTAQIYIDTKSLLGPLMHGLAVEQDVAAQVDVVRQTLLSRPNMLELARATDLDMRAETPVELDNLVKDLTAQVELDTRGRELFRISYTSESPQLSQRVVSSLLNIFVDKNLGASQDDADMAERFIDQQIARYDRELKEAEEAVAQFKREHSEELGGSDRALRQIEQQTSALRSMQEALASLHWSRNQLRTQLAETPEFTTTSSARAASPQSQQLAELRQKLGSLLLTYTDKHPDVVATRRLIEGLERSGGGGGGSTETRTPNPDHAALAAELRGVEGQIEATQRRIANAEERMLELENLVQQTPEAEAELTQLTRDYEIIRGNYEALISRREAARLARDMKTDTSTVEFRIVEPPIVPVSPSGPPHGLYMVAVLFAGLGAGIALALLRLQLAGGFQTSEDIGAAFGLPVLGSISKIRKGNLPGTMAEGAAFVSSVAALLLVFGTVFYFYQFRDEKPDVQNLLSGGWSGQVESQVRRLL